LAADAGVGEASKTRAAESASVRTVSLRAIRFDFIIDLNRMT
jgi:hypothetical protein